ncbi:major capsid family protein [Burkholderia cenocepacia]|uniref:major capsid family protein n=1 Tax=Burkholderia cenocepacia TaxID=95486 RepID=UPI002AAFF681|nr:major capsid family protein [Burkholderia cenocepacia]
MAAFDAFVKASPSFTEPELIVSYTQQSGAFAMLAGGAPEVKIGHYDQYVYQHMLEVRSVAAVNQGSPNVMPNATFRTSYGSVPTYLLKTHAQYDHHEIAAAANWNVNLADAKRLAAYQGIFQAARNGLLFGFTPSNNEGLLNAQGATAVSIPPDAQGHTTLSTMNAPYVFQFLLQTVQDVRKRILNVGQGEPVKVVITSTQDVIGFFESTVVDLTSFQRVGAGVDSIKGATSSVNEWNGVDIEWRVDDNLKGQGAGGTDAILVIVPELAPQGKSPVSTNVFADKLQPSSKATARQYFGSDTPLEYTAQLPGGFLDITYEHRMTPGWMLRPKALSIVSVKYA